MKRLDRYVWQEMWVPFFAGTFVVALLFQANSYIWLAKTFNLDNVPVLARAQWLVYTLPSQLKLTLPTGMALAAALSVGRMARESEVTAIRAAGTSVKRLMLPVVVFGLFAGALNYFIVDRLIPYCGKRSRELEAKNAVLAGIQGKTTFKQNAYIQLKEYTVSLGSVTRNPDDTLTLGDVLLIARSGPNISDIITARQATYDAGLWDFPNSISYEVSGQDIWSMKVVDLRIDQTTDLDALFAQSTSVLDGGDEEKPTEELHLAIETAKREHGDPRRYEIEIQTRYAAGVACSVFAFTSAVFAVAFSRSGGFAGLLVSFSVVVLYYNAYVISNQIIGKMDSVPSWLAAWLPNILFGLLGLLWVRRLE